MSQVKKVGVFTLYHKNVNYGATLQAYSLQKKINEQGFDACVINFVPNELSFSYRLFRLLCHPQKLFKALKKYMVEMANEYEKMREELGALENDEISLETKTSVGSGYYRIYELLQSIQNDCIHYKV